MIKARVSGSKVYLYFMKKGRQARHHIPRNSCNCIRMLDRMPMTSRLASIQCRSLSRRVIDEKPHFPLFPRGSGWGEVG